MEITMKKLSMLAAAALIATAATTAPVAAQQAQNDDPFVATAGLDQAALIAILAAAGVFGIIAASGTD
jgi:hypothetical protein